MFVRPRIGRKMDLTIERLGINGEGVGHWYGYTIFVDGALPGELVHTRLIEQRKSFGRAVLIEILTPSPHRLKPPCPLFGQCGGCQVMHMDYSQQLESKRMRIVDALQRIGKFVDVEISPCMPSPSTLAYRNKIQLPYAPGNKLGLYSRNSRDLVEIEQCHIHCPRGEEAFQKIQHIVKSSSLVPYDPETGEGELKHVLIKTAVFTDQVLVILVTQGEVITDLMAVAEQIMQALPQIKGVVQNINTSQDNVVLGNEFRTLAGQSAIEEKLLGLYFKVSPASFFQVNPAQAENIYKHALEFCQLSGQETVLDAFCGVGTLSLVFAQHAKEVIAVECVPDAIEDARENARRNDISNVRFTCAQAEDFMETLSQIDIAVLNPPRRGCDSLFLERLAALQPKHIAYISCDPATLARDLAILASKGYQIKNVRPFDMFPQTAHVECFVGLTRLFPGL